jgi:hypothetical protein
MFSLKNIILLLAFVLYKLLFHSVIVWEVRQTSWVWREPNRKVFCFQGPGISGRSIQGWRWGQLKWRMLKKGQKDKSDQWLFSFKDHSGHSVETETICESCEHMTQAMVMEWMQWEQGSESENTWKGRPGKHIDVWHGGSTEREESRHQTALHFPG